MTPEDCPHLNLQSWADAFGIPSMWFCDDCHRTMTTEDEIMRRLSSDSECGKPADHALGDRAAEEGR